MFPPPKPAEIFLSVTLPREQVLHPAGGYCLLADVQAQSSNLLGYLIFYLTVSFRAIHIVHEKLFRAK